MHRWTLGADQLESSFAENELTVLGLNMSDVESIVCPCKKTKKTSGMLGSALRLCRGCFFTQHR